MKNEVADEQGTTVGNDTGSSDMQIYSRSSFNDNALTMRRIVIQLGMKYSLSSVLRRVKFCPDTRCNNYRVSWHIIKHFREAHPSIPRFTIELNKCYEIPLELLQLEYGRSESFAILLFPLTTGSEPPNDHATMPLVVLASKIHPCGNLQYVESYMEQSNREDERIMNDGDMLMIWVCGQVRALRTILKLTDVTGTRRYVYSGCIHDMIENNHSPHVVFTRGNCLLVPAQYITTVTDNGTLPLDLTITIFLEEQDL